MVAVQPPETIAECDRQLERTHEQFIRAERRGDLPEATSLWLRLETLFDLRAHLPQQRTAVD